MTPSETLTLATYFFVLVILAVYGWHRYYLVYLYMKNKDKMPVRVHTRETKVVERGRAHRVLHASRRVGRRQRSGPNLFKKCE